jgi:hypothetical protein
MSDAMALFHEAIGAFYNGELQLLMKELSCPADKLIADYWFPDEHLIMMTQALPKTMENWFSYK